ncbi:MAG: hypothetical protein R3253_13685 [Longimicrobiales bacterium]|nr:hypothetical protein [Longimicrobiales bacterium]
MTLGHSPALASVVRLGLLLGCLVVAAPLMVAGQLPDSMPPGAAEADSIDSSAAYTGPLPRPAREALAYILTSSPDTPNGMGLLAVGMAEAEIAAEHVALAGRDTTSLSNMQRHMSHVLHAVDPAEVGQGPGMGYGVRRAARQILEQARLLEGLAATDPGSMGVESEDPGIESEVPGVLRYHAPWVARAARGTIARTQEVTELARQVQRASSARAAHRLVERLANAVRAMAHGYDADGDGRIGHTEAEMGLAQVRHHLSIVERLTR